VKGSERLTVEAENLRHLQHEPLEDADDLVNGPGNRFDELRSQMSVDGRGLGRLMAQDALNDSQVDPRFQQVRTVGMAKAMDMSCFLDAALLDRSPKGRLHVLGLDGLRVTVVANTCREQPLFGRVGPPELPEQKQRPFWQGHIPLFGTFAQNAHHHARAVDILDLEKGALTEAQTARIDRGQARSIHRKTDRRQNPEDFLPAQDHWQLLVFGWAHELETGPAALERALEEELDGAQIDRSGRTAHLLDYRQMQEILAQFILRDEVRGFVVELGQLDDAVQVALLSAEGETMQLHVLHHSSTKRRHVNPF